MAFPFQQVSLRQSWEHQLIRDTGDDEAGEPLLGKGNTPGHFGDVAVVKRQGGLSKSGFVLLQSRLHIASRLSDLSALVIGGGGWG